MRVDLDMFERFYSADLDPWAFATSSYEQRKYDLSVASLPRRNYRRCFEPGSSIGALTERLARVADEVIAMEASPSAAATARRRLDQRADSGDRAGTVVVLDGSIPEDWPHGEFDLIVLSEIGYYWDAEELATIVALARQRLTHGGHLLGVHWLGHSDDHLLNGNEVHAIIADRFGSSVVSHREPQFVLDVWQRS